MKKILGSVFAAVFCSAGLFAYNPPAGSQNYLRLTSPYLLTGANSAAGGAVFDVIPSSIINNPALTAWEQRPELDAAGTFLKSSRSGDDSSIGGAFEAGILMPSRWGVVSFVGQGVWSDFLGMDLGESVNLTAGFAKDITDQVSVGFSVNGGYLFGDDGSDWTVSAALGAYYNYGNLLFMKDVRFGAAVTNLGKMYSGAKTFGLDAEWDVLDKFFHERGFETNGYSSSWPGLPTLRTGVAATLIRSNYFESGLSLDVAYPGFQNLVADVGLQMTFVDHVRLSSAWEFDLQEFRAGAKNLLPSVGVSVKFAFESKDGSYLSRKGWQQSEMTVSGAWKRLYGEIDAISAGAVVDLGLADRDAPEIILWGDKK